ncbi:Metallo-dependent hydrolase [Aspergillus sclerotioniger CBS 115572]|uniref:Metallo-dependent hydrolase n=1 Tax=Aspergillus sclerotioniger CBS 115572 TaxID=1450535 RepID=A0A317V229_9EURO|nr:Metallo-dependent hydrolase [Aspergillus sclerotioniger CBS 115572]PWY66822.1 Metallo-dependent hydrolase [Aspergillus sclerotioniger CBS 115572]
MSPAYTLFVGTFIQLPRTKTGADHQLAITRGALWVSNTDGQIKGFDWSIANEKDLKALLKTKGWTAINDTTTTTKSKFGVKVTLVVAREDQNEFFFPGFIDTHIHAPQYPNSGLFGSSGLLSWLQTYTFPIEKSFGSTQFPSIPPPQAYRVYNQVIARTLANGTTCASYFATIHVPPPTSSPPSATRAANAPSSAVSAWTTPPNAPTTTATPLRRPPSPPPNPQSPTFALSTPPPPSSTPSSPRASPLLHRPALSRLAQLATSTSPPMHIQTHLSENLDECALVHSLFPESKDYTSVYDHFGLLTPRTILAHGIHLSDSERSLIASRNAKISHCPASNSALGSGICQVRKALDAGITVGLGTDVSGGYSSSVLETVRQACLVSRLLPQFSTTSTTTTDSPTPTGTSSVPREILSIEEALYLATRGGASVVDMADQIGGFDRNMSWDAQMIKLGKFSPAGRWGERGGVNSVVDVFGDESWTEKVHKWVWNGDDRNVRMVWVQGKLVHEVVGEGEGGSKGKGWRRWVWGLWGWGLLLGWLGGGSEGGIRN